MFKTQLCFW